MRKLFGILILILAVAMSNNFVLSDDLDPTSSSGGDWSSFDKTINNSFSGQKAVTDEQFNKTLEEIKARRGGRKRKKKEINSLSPVPYKTDTYSNNEMQSLYNKLQNTPTIMIPTSVVTEEGTKITAGYYKLTNKKINDNYIFELTQGNTTIADIQAKQTNEDFHQQDINFVDVSPISQKYLRIIYGTVDLNLEAYLEIEK